MSLQLGQTAPDFTADSSQDKIHFQDWAKGHWTVFFSHPKDFTPICTTELGQFARRKAEFDQRGAQLIGLSVDPPDSHREWIKDVAKVGGAEVSYPIVADPDLKIAKQYGMFHPEADATVTVRSVFLIDPKQKVRLILTYPPSIGRNIDEILRALDALQQADKQGVATPVDWKPGQDVVVPPSVSDADAEKRYPGKIRKVTSYLRFVPAEK
ncbi:MAG: peroxiredoxin [Proteobacteria bacterium]|nr:peroxiredoxin [Pseudomonadota bacterium]